MFFRVLLLLSVAIPIVLSQQLFPVPRPNIGSCSSLSNNSDIFGNRTHFSDQGLLPTLFIDGNNNVPLTLRVLRVHLQCEASGLYRNTASSVTFLVEYIVPSNGTPRFIQVSLDCVTDPFNPSTNYSFFPLPQAGSTQPMSLNTAQNSLGTLFTDSSQITSTFSTPSAYNCGRCGPQNGSFADQATRCVCKCSSFTLKEVLVACQREWNLFNQAYL